MTAQSGKSEPEIFGNYTLLEQIGSGGMATVHRAVQRGIEGFERTVALKRLLPELVHDDDFVKAFVREARIASQLRHVNCAQTYDLGKVGIIYYIAMELVEGPDLRKLLRQTATVTGPMPVPLIVNLLTQLCDALDYAHTLCDEKGEPMGIIHRDVSPANVIVSARDGTAKLIDFGIAKASAANLATQSGLLKGKFAYMAPENLTGAIDARADLFAIGVMAHELLTARPLFAGGDDDFETLKRVRSMPIVTPSEINRDVPADLDTIVLTALARNPNERWQSAAAMRGALQNLARNPVMSSTRQDIAKWMEWAFAQAPGSKPSPAPRARQGGDTDSPAITMDADVVPADSTMNEGLNPQPDTTNPEILSPGPSAGGGPAKTLMFGSGVVPPRTTGSHSVPGAPSSVGPHVVSKRVSAPMAAVTPPSRVSTPVAAQTPPSRISAPVASQPQNQRPGVATTPIPPAGASSPSTSPSRAATPAAPIAAGTPHQMTAQAAQPNSSLSAGAVARQSRSRPSIAPEIAAAFAPQASQQSMPTAPVKVPSVGFPIGLLLLVCLGVAGLMFALVYFIL